MYEINRSVIIVVPREPFWYWLKGLPDVDVGELTLEEIQEDSNSYLLPACQNWDEVWDAVEANLETIFAAELADWWQDETEWLDLHIDIFTEWFDVKVSSIATDLAEEEIEREPFEPLDIN
nr:VacJ [Alysiella crassa]UOP07831.1 VacJ [Alysiella crassa]